MKAKRRREVSKSPAENRRRRKPRDTDPPLSGGYKPSKSRSDDYERILKQHERQKKAAIQKKNVAFQREKSVGYIKTVNQQHFVFQWIVGSSAISSHKPLCKRCACTSCGLK
ncbi:hypothetical protein PoB_000930100 [Plakobranchus ocellatus]|uniref:Uncharacterized protein n=1 Tax=Plakobranchus ocellatus TaxID=259542 RepID=A0AAV3YK92_9GAST|nr:hypothetical protein PoB_000930100 [Plakobranchus ocellatus]